MKCFIALLFILFLAISNVVSMPNADAINVQAPTACGNGFIPLGTKCYQFNTTLLSWDDALSACIAIGANLAHISDYDENRLIVESLLDNYQGYSGFWVGANDQAVEGEFVWSDDNSPISYENWVYGQPDDYDGLEDCLILWEDVNWAWVDADCVAPFPFVCQE